MKKVFKVLKIYLLISFVLSSIIIIDGIVSMVRSNTLPTVDLFYIGNVILSTIMLTFIFVPGIALLDWSIIKSAKSLYKDYKESDRRGKIIIIVVFISILLRKILIWTS